MVRLPVVGLRGVRGRRGGVLDQLFVQLAPFLLGPAQLLGRGGEVEEMNGNDRGPGTKVCVADEGVQLSPRRRKPLLDLSEPLDLLGCVAVWLWFQNRAPSLNQAEVPGFASPGYIGPRRRYKRTKHAPSAGLILRAGC